MWKSRAVMGVREHVWQGDLHRRSADSEIVRSRAAILQ